MLSSLLFVSLLAAADTLATILDSSILVHRALSDHLQSRQAPTLDPSVFPQQCQKICTPMINTFNTCSSLASSQELQCMCTTSNGQALKICLDCLVDVLPSQARLTEAQSALTTFNQDCREFNLPPYSIDPIDPQSSTPPPVSSLSTPSAPTPPASFPMNPVPTLSPQPSSPVPSSPNTNGGNGGINANNNGSLPRNGAYVNSILFGGAFGVVVLAMIL